MGKMFLVIYTLLFHLNIFMRPKSRYLLNIFKSMYGKPLPISESSLRNVDYR